MNYFLHLILISLQFSKNPEGMNKCISIEAGSIFFFVFFGSVVFKDDFFSFCWKQYYRTLAERWKM